MGTAVACSVPTLQDVRCALMPVLTNRLCRTPLRCCRRAAAGGSWSAGPAGQPGGACLVASAALVVLAAGAAAACWVCCCRACGALAARARALSRPRLPTPHPRLAALQPSYALTLELSEADKNFDDKIDVLESNELQQATEFVLRADAAPDASLLPLLRLLNLQGAAGAGLAWVGLAGLMGGAGAGAEALPLPPLPSHRPPPLSACPMHLLIPQAPTASCWSRFSATRCGSTCSCRSPRTTSAPATRCAGGRGRWGCHPMGASAGGATDARGAGGGTRWLGATTAAAAGRGSHPAANSLPAPPPLCRPAATDRRLPGGTGGLPHHY